MGALKHLPVDMWPAADGQAFAAAYLPGDIFDETAGPGSHLSQGSRRIIEVAYRRWLGFLLAQYPDDLGYPPADRITPALVRAFVGHLESEVRPTTVTHGIENLYYAARLIDPKRDWQWLKEIGKRLAARGHRLNRFDRLVPGVRTLDFGIELMDTALALPVTTYWKRRLQYRDGLIIAFLSLWPIRRRSIAALTVDRHLAFDDAGLSVLLDTADTKSKRQESCRLPPQLVPYVTRYLDEVRPHLLHGRAHAGLWPSKNGGPIGGDRIYSTVRKLIIEKFGKDMCLHDFRRAAATFIAIDMPEKIGLIPGVLQQAGPEVGEQHYNLANAMKASERYTATMSNLKTALRSKLKMSAR